MQQEQFGEMNRRNMEAAARLAQLSIETFQKMVATQSELARQLFQECVDNVEAQARAEDPQEIIGLRTQYAQDLVQKMLESAQMIAQISNDTRGGFARLVTEQLAAGNQQLMDSFQPFFKVLPGQSPNVMAALQQAMAGANAAFAQITQISGQAFGDLGGGAKNTPKARK